MALTRSFRDTVADRARHDTTFRAALIEEAMQAFVDGDVSDARSLLRDCINATIGFAHLAEATHTPVKSLMRMVGPNGNPRADKLAAVFRAVQDASGVHAKVDTAGTATSSEWIDPDDAPELKEEFFRDAEYFHGNTFIKRGPGRPPTGNAKDQISVRLDQEVLAKLRTAGPGWQTQVNTLLRQALGFDRAPSEPETP